VPIDGIIFGSAGVLVPNMEAKIVDTASGKSVGVGESTLLCGFITTCCMEVLINEFMVLQLVNCGFVARM